MGRAKLNLKLKLRLRLRLKLKLKLMLMSSSRSCRITFENKKKGLIRRPRNLKSCAARHVCYHLPNRMPGEGLVEPEISSPDTKEVERIFRPNQSEATDRHANHASGLREFFASQKKNIDAELAKARKANWEAKYPISAEYFNGLSEPQLRSHLSAVCDKLKQAKARLAAMKEEKRSVETVATSDSTIPSA